MPIDPATAQEGSADMQIPLRKLSAANLDAVLVAARLKPAARALIAGCRSVPEALARLENGGLAREAVRLVAHALPTRETVWWACMCASHTAPADLAESDRQAVEAAEAWVRRPSDESRLAATGRAEAADTKSPEVWAATAVAWSGEPSTPPDTQRRAPSRKVPGTAVASAVVLASLRTSPERSRMRLERFLESAHDIASGGGGRLPQEAA
jgi:hypothetical protein